MLSLMRGHWRHAVLVPACSWMAMIGGCQQENSNVVGEFLQSFLLSVVAALTL